VKKARLVVVQGIDWTSPAGLPKEPGGVIGWCAIPVRTSSLQIDAGWSMRARQ